MTAIDTTILQRRVETLIAQSSILTQDVAALRQRVEEIYAHVELTSESLRQHVEASNAQVIATLQELLDRKP